MVARNTNWEISGKQMIVVGAVVVALAAAILAYTLHEFAPGAGVQDKAFVHEATFDRSRWREIKWRRSMVRDLTTNHLRVGQPRADVEALVGKPDFDPDGDEWSAAWLVHSGMLSSEYVYARFDADGLLTHWSTSKSQKK